MKTIVGFRKPQENWYREKNDAVKWINGGVRKHIVGIDEDGKPVYGSWETTPTGGTTVHPMLVTWDVNAIQDVSYQWQKIPGTLDSIPEGYQLSPDAKLETMIIIGLDGQKALDTPKTEIIEPEQPVGGDEPKQPTTLVEKMIQFTPHNYGWAYYIAEPFEHAGYYTEMQRRANLNGVGDYLRANNLYLRSSGIRKPILTNQTHPTQSYHFTKINQAGVIENVTSQKDLNYLLCKEFSQKAYGTPNRKTFISEDGNHIQNQIDNWYLGENWEEKEATVGADYVHKVGDIFWVSFWFNGGTLTFDVPEGLEFIGRDLDSTFYNYTNYRNSSGTLTYAKTYDHDYNISGNTVSIVITPTDLFHVDPQTGEFVPEENRTSGVYAGPGIMQRNNIKLKRRSIGAFQFKAVAAGEFYLPFANGYIKIIGEGVAQPELIKVNLANERELQDINHVGPATAKNIITERQKAPLCNAKDLENVKYIGKITAEKINKEVDYTV